MIQPPKISPLGFVSAGIAIVRITSSPFGPSEASMRTTVTYRASKTIIDLIPERSSELQNQHAIAVAIKTVPLLNRRRIRIQKEPPPSKRAHKHQKG